MATKKYLDLSGLAQYDTKIKSVIPNKTSDLTNDSGFITDSKVVIVEYGSNVYYSTLKNYIDNGYEVICKYDYDGIATYMYYPLTEVYESITPYYCGFSGFATNGGSNLRLKLTKNMTNNVESYGNWSFEYRNIDEDIRINNVSIVSNNIANIETNGTYNSSTNKIATMSDVPLKTIIQAVKTSDTTNYSTSYNYFSPFNGDGDASVNINIGSGLTFGKKTVTYGDRTNNSVYGVTIGAGISLIKVYYSTRYLNNHTANVGVNSNIYRKSVDGTPEIVYGTTTTMPSSTRAVLTGEHYMEVQEGDFIFIGGYRTLKASDVDVISTNNATSMYIEVIQ